MKPGLPPQPVTIDNIQYPSLSAAAKAHKISRDRLTDRVEEYGHVLTGEQIAIKKIPKPKRIRVDKPPAKSKSSSPLSWEFVYSRISSSPKTRGVDSSPAAYQSA